MAVIKDPEHSGLRQRYFAGGVVVPVDGVLVLGVLVLGVLVEGVLVEGVLVVGVVPNWLVLVPVVGKVEVGPAVDVPPPVVR